ncbi:hypothetical protein HDU81_004015 [Chytriomyces hyalinus]|nr:hypothetical protein HDU81_004015 [Chytriomyces hyalinus]
MSQHGSLDSSQQPLIDGMISKVKSVFGVQNAADLQKPSDVQREEMRQNRRSIWSVAIAADPSPEDMVNFVKEEKRRRLDEWLVKERTARLGQDGSAKESVGLYDTAAEVDFIANDRGRTKRFCMVAKQIELDIWMERGAQGETLLHHALLLQQPRLLDFMLGTKLNLKNASAPGLSGADSKSASCLDAWILARMINCVFEGVSYYGEHAAHIAVVVFGDDTKVLKALLDKGADVIAPRARGVFFSHDVANSVYMGETVLAFAAVMGHQAIVDYLIYDVGVDPNQTDSNGNNVIHVLASWGYVDNFRGIDMNSSFNNDGIEDNVDDNGDGDAGDSDNTFVYQTEQQEDESPIHNRITKGHIYHQLETGIRRRKFAKGKEAIAPQKLDGYRVDDSQQNLDGHTPLIVAVYRSQEFAVEAMLMYKARSSWTYGSVERTRVCLSEIDTYMDNVTMNHTEGALAIAVKNADIDILSLPVFRALLESKWTLYARRMFTFKLIADLIYMLLFSVALWLLPNDASFSDPQSRSSARSAIYGNASTAEDWVRLVLEIILVLANFYRAYKFIYDAQVLGDRAFYGFSAQNNRFKYVNFVLFLGIIVVRIANWTGWETAFMSLYAILGWLQMLYFFRGFKDIGPLSMVFTNIIQNDVSTFLMILVIVLFGFGPGIWLQLGPFGDFSALNNGAPGDVDWKDVFPGNLIWALRLFYGQGSYDTFRQGTTPVFAILLFLVFFFIVNIILLNVFIGMIGSTFGRVFGKAENEYYQAWAWLIMEIDELLNAEHERKAGSRGNSPITRIGIPRRTKIFNSKEVKANQRDPVVYEYDLHLEFHGNAPKPKHIFASLDPSSPLSEVRMDQRTTSRMKDGRFENRRRVGSEKFNV